MSLPTRATRNQGTNSVTYYLADDSVFYKLTGFRPDRDNNPGDVTSLSPDQSGSKIGNYGDSALNSPCRASAAGSGFGPRFLGLRVRRVSVSSRPTNSASPSGRPTVSA